VDYAGVDEKQTALRFIRRRAAIPVMAQGVKIKCFLIAGVAELVDAHDSKSCLARGESSILSSGTKICSPAASYPQ
jgi:hypothetical protein